MINESYSGYYVHFDTLLPESEAQEGAMLKVGSQLAAFNNAGIRCDYWRCASTSSIVKKMARRTPFLPDGFNWVVPPDVESRDFIFIRKPIYTISFLQFLREVRRRNNNILILIEVFTFPYDAEYYSCNKIMLLLRDIYNRHKVGTLVDRYVSPARVSSIFSVSSIYMPNGIDLKKEKPRSPCRPMNTMNIICPATFAFWHGIDRFIDGLKDYYDSGGARNVVFHVVGDGPAINGLKKQVQRGELSNHVVFHGRLGREEMGEVYDRCSLAVECLGMHRRDPSMVSSSLKSREYLAKGMPFIYSAPIDVFEEDPVDFCMRVPADDSPIDIQSVIDFHDRLYSAESEEHVIERIRAYAEEHVSWDATMRPVIDYIKRNVRK